MRRFWKRVKFAVMAFKNYDKFSSFIPTGMEYCGSTTPSQVDNFLTENIKLTGIARDTGLKVIRRMSVWGW